MKRRRIAVSLFLAACFPGCAPQGGPETGTEAAAEPPRGYDPAQVIGRTWEWAGTQTPVEFVAVADPGRYTMYLGEDGRARIRFDCNTGGGAYEIAEAALVFGDLISTRMACPPDTQDAIFARQLKAVRIFFVEAGVLYLDLYADGGTMRFRPAPGD
jgi:heat shock protein HslJ